MPWKNGGGVTREIAVAAGEMFAWRLSMASVNASGPFSDFTGYERTLVILRGDGFTLTFADGREEILEPLRPLVFDGGEIVSCQLQGGPVTDFNLMVARDRARGALRVVRATGGEKHRFDASGTLFVHVVSGALRCGDRVVVAEHTLRVDGEHEIELVNLAETVMIIVQVADQR